MNESVNQFMNENERKNEWNDRDSDQLVLGTPSEVLRSQERCWWGKVGGQANIPCLFGRRTELKMIHCRAAAFVVSVVGRGWKLGRGRWVAHAQFTKQTGLCGAQRHAGTEPSCSPI